MSYESWRISYQSSEQAARAAFDEIATLRAQLAASEARAERYEAIRHTLHLFRKAQIDLMVPTEKLMPEDIGDAVAWLVLHMEIGEGTCPHGVRLPHECKACADEVSDADVAAWAASAALAEGDAR